MFITVWPVLTNTVINMRKFIDLTGKRFGKLTVLERVENTNPQIRWKCKCDCGTEKTIQGGHLRSGHTSSCGCSWYEYGENHVSWKGYKEISGKYFKSVKYNARTRNLTFNITLEQLWDIFIKQDRKCALSGIPLAFEANHGKIKGNASLDRIDPSKGYTIDNVQWVHSSINNMKWNMPQQGFLGLCFAVYHHHERRQ